MKRPFWLNSPTHVGTVEARAVAFTVLREEMVQQQIAKRGIADQRVLAAMRRVPRHEFVPAEKRESAYEDRPLAIGFGQTISQPYIVAFMTEALQLPEHARVMEVGTGSAYQTAVLAEIAGQVFSVEIVPELATRAAALLSRLGYKNIETAERDGYEGWLEHAPYDGILVAAAAEEIPVPLVEQLKPEGRLIIPVRSGYSQQLVVVTRVPGGFREEARMLVSFVPMTGNARRVGHGL
jgi:protein-L-isoaspartate(D-aspartate) O-methyltransferase